MAPVGFKRADLGNLQACGLQECQLLAKRARHVACDGLKGRVRMSLGRRTEKQVLKLHTPLSPRLQV